MKKIVAITACITGLAHTYLAEEALKEAAKLLGVLIKVETKGAIGTENKLTSLDINEAVGVIIAADIKIDTKRFLGKKVIMTSTKEAIQNPKILIQEVLNEQI